MTAKEYLSQLKILEVKITQLANEKEYLEGQLANASIAPKDVQVMSSVPADPMADRVARIVDIENEINSTIDRLIDTRAMIVRQIQQLKNPVHISILYKRFVELKPVNRVFDEIRSKNPAYIYSDRQLFRAYRNALAEFEKCHKMS